MARFSSRVFSSKVVLRGRQPVDVMKSTESGTLAMDESGVSYSSDVLPDWTLRVGDISMIAEVTTDDGPFADDYFVVFVNYRGEMLWASWYADGRDQVIAELSAVLSGKLRFELVFSTSHASRVIWPEHLRGTALPD